MRVAAGLSNLCVFCTPDSRFSFAYSGGDNASRRARQEEKHPIPCFLSCLGKSLAGPDLRLSFEGGILGCVASLV